MDPVRHGNALPGIHVRVCPDHKLELKPIDEQSDELLCPFQGGHVAERWKVVDTRAQRAISVATADKHDGKRRELTPIEDLREAHPIRRLPPAGRLEPVGKPVEQGGEMVVKCSRCGGNGHNKRTCKNEPSAGATAPLARAKKAEGGGKKRAARPAASSAIALTRGRADLEKVRAILAADLAKMDRAILAFNLIEKRIPRACVDVARELLVEAGISKAALEGRQSVAVAQLAVGVSAVLFLAARGNKSQKEDILTAAAQALGHEQKE